MAIWIFWMCHDVSENVACHGVPPNSYLNSEHHVILGIWDTMGYPQAHVGARISPAIPIRPYQGAKSTSASGLMAVVM